MMKTTALWYMLTACCVSFLMSCGGNEAPTEQTEKNAALKAEAVTYTSDSVKLKGYAAYDANKEKAPVILIVHEWWGLNNYAKNRAKQLAEMGYFVFAVDMYGNGKIAENPEEAGKCAMPFYTDPAMANKRIQAALDKIKTYPQADVNNCVAIGYCFGGSMVLNAARAGMPFKGVVSFHGGLAGLPADKSKLKAQVLVCHGAADKFVADEEVAKFKKEMDSIGANYTFKAYADATHAFTNPDATANGKKFNLPIAYNKKADNDSWKDFMTFLKDVLDHDPDE